MEIVDRAGVSQIGLGLAAVGRYINLGRATDLPAERTVETIGATRSRQCQRRHYGPPMGGP